MEQISWRTERRKVIDLIPADYNPRRMTPKEREDLEGSLREFSEAEPIVINLDGTIIGGHQRTQIYADMGVEEVDVLFPHRKLSVEERVLVGLESNRNDGEWDWEILSDEDEAILYEAGFSDDEMRMGFGLSDAEMAEVDEDRIVILTVLPPEAPKLREKVGIRFGSIDDYQRVKDAVEKGSINAESLMKLL